ncbi:MAG: 16S rRNA (cytidine(1402)-2'-O)-methyltransferase [Bdellovibrionota bacterium]
MLYLVATPIGDPQEISLRALTVFKMAEVVICESTKETAQLLKFHGITGKKFEILDEHSKADDLKYLLELCRQSNVALASDCGTPGFCDPGAELVKLCNQNDIAVKSVLGASSLMGLISLSGQRLDQFLFRGFLPAENQAREEALKELRKQKQAIIIMDTPYRLQKTLNDIERHFAERELVLALNLSNENEQILRGKISQIRKMSVPEKAEFMLLILK